MPKITYLPSHVSIEIGPASSLRDAAIEAGVTIASTCGGVASCGLCKVRIVSGAEHLSALTPGEVGKLGNVFFITKERLACQTRASGDVTCEVPDETEERARRATKAKDLHRERLVERSRAKARR